MSKNYDNWERLVTAVVRRERDNQIALSHSRDPSSISSSSSSLDLSFTSTSQFDHDQSIVLRERSEFIPMDYSDLTPLDHRDWKMMLATDKQELVWRTLGLRFFLDQTTGKNCFLLGATFLKIKVYGAFDKFSIKPHPKSRFLIPGGGRDCIHDDDRYTRHDKNRYAVTIYFIFSIPCVRIHGELSRAYSSIKFLCGDDNSVKGSQLVYFKQGNGRADGWKETHLGDFYVGMEDNREIQVKLVDIDVPWKSGLTVEGIEFRPSE